jgi:hypothetical protein
MMASLATITAKTRPIKGCAIQWLSNGVAPVGRCDASAHSRAAAHYLAGLRRSPGPAKLSASSAAKSSIRWAERWSSLRTSPAIRPAP